MNAPSDFHEPEAPATLEDMQAALFANLVMQQAQTAYMLLGKAPHPETGRPVVDLEAAKYFIELLEMLETKTKGNLDSNEKEILSESLATLHTAFLEVAQKSGVKLPPPLPSRSLATPSPKEASPPPAAREPVAPAAPAAAATSPAPAPTSAPAPAPAPAPSPAPQPPEESRKKFSKRY